jgi:acetolactate synthase-1/2/3 large subunit
VYIEIPEDVMREANDAGLADVWEPAERYHGRLGLGDPESIEQAADLLASAERPFLHAGTGVAWAEAWDEFRALADHLAAGVTTSLGARGVFPEDHPRFLQPLDFEALEAARGEADVVLAVGARLGELEHWGRPPFWGDPSSQKLIQIDADPASIGLNRPVEIGIVADAKAALAALLDAVKKRTGPRQEGPEWERYRKLSGAWQEQKEMALSQEGEAGVNPGRMVQVVREFFPRDAITVMDGGNTSLWTASFNPIYEPRSYLYTAKFGHLGTGLPYALGAKLAAPDRQVYLITGDGALGFNIQELETASRYRLPVVIVVAVDRGWGMERSSQVFAGIEGMVETELNPEVRYDKVAEGFGCHGEMVESLEELRPALERSVASGKPALIQVMVDPMVNMAPPGLVEFGSMVYRAED